METRRPSVYSIDKLGEILDKRIGRNTPAPLQHSAIEPSGSRPSDFGTIPYNPQIQARLGKYSCEEGIALLQGAGIPVARVRTISEAIEDEHFRARGTLKPMYRQGWDEPVEGGVVSGFPVKFSGGALPALDGGPQLGHHNREVFGRLLGLDAESVAELEKRGVV